MLDDTNSLTYVPEPTGQAFLDYRGRLKGIKGPIGSGKSSVCIMQLLTYATEQKANPAGVRRSKWLIIRSTYAELDQTTIRTFKLWIPNTICQINRDYPRIGQMNFRLPDGTVVEAEFIFLALDGEKSEEKVKSLDITGGWINEASGISQAIFEAAYSRKGRYPLKTWPNGYKERASWSGFLIDTNPPPITHWYAKFAKHEASAGAFFDQPPAVLWDEEQGKYVVNENAENLGNLDENYYQDLLQQYTMSQNISFIRVMLMGEYGQIQRGTPVFGNYFSDQRHTYNGVSQPSFDLPIVVGLDWGLNFAACFTQMDYMGNVNVFEEIVESDVSLEEMIAKKIKPLMNGKYRNHKVLFIGDPAGRGRSGNDKKTPFMLMIEAGYNCKPAITNNFVMRRDSVTFFMQRTNGLKINSKCIGLVQSLGSGYIMDSSGENPEKNEHSHIADAFQYACLFHKHGLAKKKRIKSTQPKVPRRKLV